MRKTVSLVAALTMVILLALPAGALAQPTFTSGGSGCAKFYTVKRGDTLFKIARAQGTTVSYLTSLNGIADPNRIAAGTTLCVKAQAEKPSGSYYTVRRGDTLYSIARRFGTTAAGIAQANGIPNPDEIYAGRVLWIPAH